MEARPRWQIWLMLLLPPVTLAVLIFGYAAWAGVAPGAPGAEERVRGALPYILALNHPLLFVLLLVLLRRNGEELGDIGWRVRGLGSSLGREILVGALCALGLYLFKELVLDSVRALLAGQTPTFTTLFRFHPASLEVPLAAAATTLVFIEESIYRGFALPAIRARRGLGAAVLITSVAFGFLHWGNGPLAVVFTAVLGALLAGVFVWRRNLVAGTVAHAAYNFMVLLT